MGLFESMRGIIPGTSQLNPDVRVSPHPASDILSFRFCSCGCNRGSFDESLEGYFSSSCYGFHRHDEDVSSRHQASLSHNIRMNGFAFLRL